jgi:hypothetical protein
MLLDIVLHFFHIFSGKHGLFLGVSNVMASVKTEMTQDVNTYIILQ